MGLYDDFNDDNLKYKSICHEELNEWFLENGEDDPKFLYLGDGANDKRGEKLVWLLLNNNKRGFMIISTRKNKYIDGFGVGDVFMPYRVYEWGFFDP